MMKKLIRDFLFFFTIWVWIRTEELPITIIANMIHRNVSCSFCKHKMRWESIE